jgi:thymidylate kinase
VDPERRTEERRHMTALVCVTGIDGAGKSTIVDALAERLRGPGHRVAVSAIWDPIVEPYVAGRTFFNDPSEVDPFLAQLDPISRMYFFGHVLHLSLVRAMALNPDVLVLNAYWYKYFATEIAHGGDPVALRAITSPFPVPDVTFQLVLPLAEAARRKGVFSGYESGFGPAPTQEAFEAFQPPAVAAMDLLASEFGWTIISGEQPEEEMLEQVLGHLHRLEIGPGVPVA